MYSKELIKSLPLYERKSEIFIEIMDSEAKQFQLLDEEIKNIREQFLIDTATWGLKIYEKELKIIVPSSSSLESRRATVKAKWRSDGKVDRALLESVASAILGTIVKVEFTGRIRFYFEVSNDQVGSFGLFWRMIDDIKPAHLGMELELRVSTTIVIKTKEYTFPVHYPITNTFTTANVNGIASKATAKMEAKEYAFKVPYPICGTFYCSKGAF